MTPLTCLVAGHTPDTMIIANGGYRFSHCRRCGVEIVQSVVSGWRVPQKGFRITWRSDRSPAPPPAQLALEDARAVAGPPQTAARQQRPADPPPLPKAEEIRPMAVTAPQPRPPARSSGDFMQSDDGGFDWMGSDNTPPDPMSQLGSKRA